MALEQVFDPENFRTQGHALIDLLANYLENQKNSSLVYPEVLPDNALEYWKNDFESNSTDLLSFYKKTLENSNHLHNPNYMGHQVAVTSPVAALTGVLTNLLNNGGAVYEMGPVNNPLEKVLSDFLGEKIGFSSDCGGFMTSGGTLANLTALLSARSKYTMVWKHSTKEKLAVLVSEEAHYCIDRAARIMGLGDEGVIKVPVNEQLQMKTEQLEDILEESKRKGLRVFAIIGSACSTSSGSYDNLKAIGNFAIKHNIWFHVDGAHGAAVIFSKKHKNLVSGIHLADSVTIDWHKMLLTPALTTHLMFKKELDSFKTFEQKAQYLWDNTENQDIYNLGKRTFECTKLMMSVKVYALIKAHGKDIFEEHVTYLYDLAKNFEKLIIENLLFEIPLSPQSNIVCFRFLKQLPNYTLDETQSKIRKKILSEGKFYIVQTTLKGQTFLRISLMNPMTTEIHLRNLLSEIEAVHSELLKNIC